MPFWIYGISQPSPGARRYTRQGNVQLAGCRNGLIYAGCQALLSPTEDTSWTISSGDMLSASGYDPDASAIFSDTVPDRPGEINLFRIISISGVTYHEWTPIMIRMEVTAKYVVNIGDEDINKMAFNAPEDADEVYTFLYLQGGFTGGKWNWGRVGLVNGPLLWPDALAYFKSQTP